MDRLRSEVEEAFHYRGDVTVTLQSGEALVGFLFNREFSPASGAPFVELLLPGGGERRLLVR